jgi:hypothetical protein
MTEKSRIRSLAARAQRKGSETITVKLSDLYPIIEELDELKSEIAETRNVIEKLLRLVSGLSATKKSD